MYGPYFFDLRKILTTIYSYGVAAGGEALATSVASAMEGVLVSYTSLIETTAEPSNAPIR